MGKQKVPSVDLNTVNWVRNAHSFLMRKKGGNYQVEDINTLNEYAKYLLEAAGTKQKSYKVGLMFIAINPPYWQYAKQVIDGVRQFFLPGHETEIMLWTDMQKYPESAMGLSPGPHPSMKYASTGTPRARA